MTDYPRRFACLVLLALLILAGCDRGNRQESPGRPTVKDETGLPAPENRAKLPEFTLPAAQDGTPVSSEALHNQVTLLIFFTPWCGSCATEMVKLQALQNKYPAARFSVIGLAMIDRDKQSGALLQFLKRLEIKFPILVSNETVQKSLGGITIVPTAFLIDNQARIVSKQVSHLDHKHLSAAIAKLLAEKD